MSKKVAIALVLLLAVSTASYAWVWLYQGASWALTSLNASRLAFMTNAGLRSATAKSLSLHASVAGVALAAPHVIDSNPQDGKVPAHVMIDLSGEGRLNPDENRYDDAAPGELDPSPKSQFDPSSGIPVIPRDSFGSISWSTVLNLMGAPAYRVWLDGGQYRQVVTVSYTACSKFSGYDCDLPGREYASRLVEDDTYRLIYSRVGRGSFDGDSCNINQEICHGASVFYKIVEHDKVCGPGYVKVDGSCQLVNSDEVLKPEKTIPCEVSYFNGQFHIDAKNPSCLHIDLAEDVQIQKPSPESIRIENPSESLTTSCGAAGCEAVYVDKTDSSWVKYTLSQPDQNKYRTVTSVETGTGSAPTPSAPGGSGGNPGGDSGGGDTGGGSGLGCTAGQPCHVLVDDSGFADKPTDLDGLNSRLDEDTDNWLDAISSVSYDDMHGVEFDWLPTIPRASCSAIGFGYQAYRVEFDLCGEKIALIKEVLGWLLYLFTGWIILNIFLEQTVRK